MGLGLFVLATGCGSSPGAAKDAMDAMDAPGQPDGPGTVDGGPDVVTPGDAPDAKGGDAPDAQGRDTSADADGGDAGAGDGAAAGGPYYDPTVASDIARDTSFLYTGTNPVQTGVVAGTIDPRRVAILRGKVIGRDGVAIAQVSVSVLGHAELGQTLTGADGVFDLAVNGGGPLTVRYQKKGLLSAQRATATPWRDYVWLPDVVLSPYDTAVTSIDLGAAGMKVARGGAVSDSDGARRATVLFPQGTTATMVMADGSSSALGTLNVRATEYTVGATGPAAMPATLPPTSAYTYAVALTIDEAVAAGARHVTFSQPVIHYVENFLHFPVGGIAPAGLYDEDKGMWVPSDNGRVIGVLDVSGGTASLDLDGTGQAAGATALAALGISDAERQQLATLYTAGQSLWRVPVPHFSALDINWPYKPECDPLAASCEPNQPRPLAGDDPLDDPNEQCGSVIGCEDQTLGESVPVVGTDFRLHYRSRRTPGRKVAYRVSIPLTGATIQPTLRRIDLVVDVAGQHFAQTFAAAANQTTTYTWDGHDAYGRVVRGERPVTIRIGYVYKAIYLQPGEGTSRAFAVLALAGFPITGSIARQEITFWQTFTDSIGPWDARASGLGGWTLDVHHAYDPSAGLLMLGDGTRRTAHGLPSIISTVAGSGGFGNGGDDGPATSADLSVAYGIAVGPDGSIYIPDRDWSRLRRVDPNGVITTIAGSLTAGSGFSGDGGPATSAKLNFPQSAAVGPDGSVYVADSSNNRIRRITRDGIINTVAGNGDNSVNFANPRGDGGPAIAAPVDTPNWIAVGPDGSIYLSDTAHRRVRRVDPDGIIDTVAGTGAACTAPSTCGDGGQATSATLSQPWGVAVAADGTLFIADNGNQRVRRVGIDGRISTVAGNLDGNFAFDGDGGPATDAHFDDLQNVSVGPDGAFYIADTNHNRIRRVGTEGIITTVAGGGTLRSAGDGGAAVGAYLPSPNHAVVAPDGALLIWGSNSRVVRRVTPALRVGTGGDHAVAAENGRDVFTFDAVGRHLKTLDALTGGLRYQFGYGTDGYLTSVTDGAGNVTKIERTGETPAALVAPGGQRTKLAVDGNAWLTTITNPANEGVVLTYDDRGLMKTFTDPLSNVHTFTHDALGRLTKDADPAGGSTTLTRAEQGDNYSVTTTSALGRTHRYRLERLGAGAIRRTVTGTDGLDTVTSIGADYNRSYTFPSGTTGAVQYAPDPRWGLMAPIAASVTIKSPAGITQTIKIDRAVTLKDKTNPLSLTDLVDTITDNGMSGGRRQYTASTRVALLTTAAGRTVGATLDSLGRVTEERTLGFTPITYAYDDAGNPKTVSVGTGADMRALSFAYDTAGYLSKVSDTTSWSTMFAYNEAGRPTQQTLPGGAVAQFAYDASGNTTGVTPPGRQRHALGYSSIDQLSSYTPPDLGAAGTRATAFTYDSEGALTGAALPGGEMVAFAFDTAGRASTTTFGRGSIAYAYSATTGRLASITAPGGIAIGYNYDGHLLTGIGWSGPVAGSVGFAYDNDFRLAAETVSGGNAVTFTYDADGRLTGAGALALTRGTNGLVTAAALASLAETFTYNSFAELTGHAVKYAGSALLDATYVRDAGGRITQKTETIAGVTDVYAYTYDGAGRLSGVAKNGDTATPYAYDGNGNRMTGPGTIAATYDAQDRIATRAGATYAFAVTGEIASKTLGGATTTYDYDAFGNLAAATIAGGPAIEYLIDGRNRRIGKKVGGVLVQALLYRDQLRPVAELDGAGNVVSRFIYTDADGAPGAMIKGGVTYRIVADHLGSPRLVVDTATGTIAQRIDYDEFGQVVADSSPGFQPFGFAGGIYDRDTKLVRLGARDYDPETGRWTAKDPTLFAGGDTNLYAYAAGDPVNAVDRDGLAPHAGDTIWIKNKDAKILVDPNASAAVQAVVQPAADVIWLGPPFDRVAFKHYDRRRKTCGYATGYMVRGDLSPTKPETDIASDGKPTTPMSLASSGAATRT